MPADITGTEVLDEEGGHRSLRFVKGPIFAQIILADEINRTPPKTQAALLEAMQEYHVTAAGRTYPLDRPFFVLATQNPIELEGTYPLPEAQLDRFMFNVVMTYLPEDEEVRVVTRTTGVEHHVPQPVLTGADILEIQQLVRQVAVAEEIARYAVRLVDASRPGRQGDLQFVREWVKWGAGLRASQALILAGKARALLNGRYHVSVADIRALAGPVLRHRVIRVGADHVRHPRRPAPRGGADAAQRDVAMPAQPGTRDLRFLDPAVIARLGTMELKARTVVEGFLAGLHRSPYKGFSVEFAEYRQYLPGDDLSTLDWKVYARSDRHYVKKYEEETNVECHLLLDVSASMAYRGAAAMSKLEYGSVLAASLAYLMNRQRDATGLITFDDRIVFRLPAAARPGHLHALLVALERITAGQRSDLGRPLHQLAEALVKRSMVVLVSDLLDEPEPIIKGLKHLRFRGSDVIVFQVLDPHELTFPFKGAARFRDLESDQQVTAEPSSIRTTYLRELAGLTLRYDRELRGAGIDYVQLDTSQPLDFALLAYLAARSRRK
jgi:MoxR-like ATPase